MKKVYAIAYRRHQAAVIDVLQEAGLVEITARPQAESGLDEPGAEPALGLEARLCAKRVEQIEAELTKVRFVADFLKRFTEKKGGVFASLMKERILVDPGEFTRISADFDFSALHEECSELSGRLDGLQRRRAAKAAERQRLGGWLPLDAPLGRLRSSESLGVAVGQVRGNQSARLRAEVADACSESDVIHVGGDSREERVVILYYLPHHVLVERALTSVGFEFADFGAFSAEPRAEIERLDQEISEISEEIVTVKKTAEELSRYGRQLLVMQEWLRARRDRYLSEAKFEHTDATLIFEGWVEASQSESTEAALKKADIVADFVVLDPGPEEEVPILLTNPRWLRPFETLTKLYGVPNHRELDPTPIMGISFFIFFGIALSDFGYGLVVAVFCQVLKRRLLLSEIGRDWLDLFTLGGVSTMIVGVLTGTYFGFEPEVLPAALQSLIILDTLKQAFIFLVFTWALGVVHISLALGLEFWDSYRSKRYANALAHDLPQIILFFFAIITATGWMGTTVFQSDAPILKAVTGIGVTGLGWSSLAFIVLSGGALTSGALTFKGFLGGLGSGLYNLYNMSGMVGDILSYSRLMALGLATLLIGFVINTLAGLLAGITMFGLPVGILLAVLVAVPMHLINIAINLLSAFVHPLRLQFVEFFSKFYENGGRSFEPLSLHPDQLVFKKE